MTLGYDFAGNRSQVTNNGTATTWTVNDLTEYTGVGTNGVLSDVKGNVQAYNHWGYTYDAQNRLRVAQGPGTTLEFWYDGRNRQITRRINGDNNRITRSVWDGWNLLEERNVNDAPLEYYLYGARTDELVLRWGGIYGDNWYGYDGRGNVSHLFGYSYNALIIERYTYDLAGKPTITPADANGNSLADNRFLFQGRDYLKEGAIYDYRNRFYHPGLGRFLQPDPVGLQFEGEKLSARSAVYFWAGKAPEKFTSTELNLYRYCGNDSVNKSDPEGTYGQGAGFTPQQWKTFDQAQKAGAEAIDKALKNMTPKTFEKTFGPGSATKENMQKITQTLRDMAFALRDNGDNGYFANATTAEDVQSRGLPQRTSGFVSPPDNKSIYINVDHPSFGGPLTVNAAVHESGHNMGLIDFAVQRLGAYQHGDYWERGLFQSLPTRFPAAALTNSDTVTSYVLP
jgi:RHS repeat-associated protein